MRKAIAKIRIAPGNPGWYDSLTKTHLTIMKPEAFVYEGQNVTNIKKGIKFKTIQLIEGSLEPVSIAEKLNTAPIEKPVIHGNIPEEVIAEKMIEEAVEEKGIEEAVEEVIEEPIQEEVVEEKKKKTTSKKNKK